MKIINKIKFVPERTDTMTTEDLLREIVAYVELTRDYHNLNKPGFELYTRASFLKFADNILSIVKQEVY